MAIILAPILLLMGCVAGQHTATNFNETFNTIDGLGFVGNFAAGTTIQAYPTATYQEITQFSNGSIQCSFNVKNPSSNSSIHVYRKYLDLVQSGYHSNKIEKKGELSGPSSNQHRRPLQQ